MADPFSNLTGSPDSDWARNLLNFGLATMAAANQRDGNGFLTYGSGALGPIGAGGLQAMQAARENQAARAQMQNTQSETQGRNLQNRLGIMNYNMLAPIYGQQTLDMQGNPQQTTPPSNPVGASYSLSAGMQGNPPGQSSASPPQASGMSQPSQMSQASGPSPPAQGDINKVYAMVRGANPTSLGASPDEIGYASMLAGRAGDSVRAKALQDFVMGPQTAGATARAEMPYKIAESRAGYQPVRENSAIYDPLGGNIVATGGYTGVVPPGQQGAGASYRVPPGAGNPEQQASASQGMPPMASADLQPGAPGQALGRSVPTFPPTDQQVASSFNQQAPPQPGMPAGATMTKLPPQNEELLKTGAEDLITKGRPDYDAANQALMASSVIHDDIKKLSTVNPGENGFVGMGTDAQERADFAKKINTLQQMAGVKSKDLMFDPDKIATTEEFNKQSLQLGFNMSRALGAREAASVVDSAIKANPNMENSNLGGQMVNNLIAETAQRRKDLFEYKIQRLNEGVDPINAEAEFTKKNPGIGYVKRAMSQFDPPVIQQTNREKSDGAPPATLSQLLPGTHFRTPQMPKSAPDKIVPTPQGYQFSMPPVYD